MPKEIKTDDGKIRSKAYYSRVHVESMLENSFGVEFSVVDSSDRLAPTDAIFKIASYMPLGNGDLDYLSGGTIYLDRRGRIIK